MMFALGCMVGGVLIAALALVGLGVVAREHSDALNTADDVIRTLEEEIEERDARFARMLPRRGPDGRFTSKVVEAA